MHYPHVSENSRSHSAAGSADAAMGDRSSGSAPCRVLIVDVIGHTLDHITALKQPTQFAHIALEWQPNQQQALSTMTTQAYALTVIRHRPGKLDGLYLLQQAIRHGYTQPIVLLIDQDDAYFMATAQAMGAVDCLSLLQFNADCLHRIFRWLTTRSHPMPRSTTAPSTSSNGSTAPLATTDPQGMNPAMAFASPHYGVVLLDTALPQPGILYATDVFLAQTGYSLAELQGQSLILLAGAETDAAAMQRCMMAIAQRQTHTETWLGYRKTGEPFWQELRLYPLPDSEGNCCYYVGLQYLPSSPLPSSPLPSVAIGQTSDQTLEQLRHQNELILNSAGEGIYGLDLAGTITFANPAAARMLGWAVEDLIGRSMHQVLQRAPNNKSIQHSQFHPDGAIHHIDSDEFQRRDGTKFPVEYTSTPITNHQDVVGTVVVFQDITQRKSQEEALRESEERYALAAQGTNDGIWDWNLKTGKIYFSPRWKSILGYAEDALPNTLDMWFDCIHPEDLYAFKRELNAHLAGVSSHLEHEHRMRDRTDDYHWVLTRGLAVRNEEGTATRVAGSLTDITPRKRIEEQLLHDALHDALTGLPNRALLMDRLRHTVEVARRNPTYLYAVLFLDLDRFKVINDSLGHMQGDCLLMAIAERLMACIRPGDTVARLGGDEFVVLLEDIRDLSSTLVVAERIQTSLAQPIRLATQEVVITSSIGLALGNTSYRLAEDLLRDADTAMYRAKARGRARYEVFNPGMHQQAVALLQLENDIRRGLERQEFYLHYQPIIALRDSRLAGFEALLRWRHPERGEIMPKEFIPVAEETEQITALEHWAMHEACRCMKDWQERFSNARSLTMHVNLSGKHFDQDLIQELQTTLTETGLSASYLNLEITESMLMENADSAVSLLKQLKELGVGLSIDDFGTGYSSLSYLHRFPIDILKVDRSFVNKLDHDPEQLAIVRTIMTLAWNLGIEVVAEGVETNKQLAQVIALQCDYGQGFHYSEPLGEEAIEAILAGNAPESHVHYQLGR